MQRMHFFFSLAVVWWMLFLVEDRFGGAWWKHSAIAAVFLTASGLLAAFIVPKALIKIVVERTSVTTKLALICNYLSIMLAMRMFTTTWKERAFTLAGIILATGVAGWFLTHIAWPVKENVATLFKEEEKPTRVDPAGPQGRKARRQ